MLVELSNGPTGSHLGDTICLWDYASTFCTKQAIYLYGCVSPILRARRAYQVTTVVCIGYWIAKKPF
jgi:hypothetical protein